MPEEYEELEPIERLRRVSASMFRYSLVAEARRCYCGRCGMTVEGSSELARCPNGSCSISWVRLIVADEYVPVPETKYQLAPTYAETVLSNSLFYGDSLKRNHTVRRIATVAVNPKYL